MSESRLTVNRAFEQALRALAPHTDDIVAIGGWAVRLLREHPLAVTLPTEALFTTDLDIALMNEHDELGVALHQALLDEGFSLELTGDETPPVSSFVIATSSGPVSVEFLLSRRGSSRRRDGSSNQVTRVGRLTAQRLPTLRLLFLKTWTVPHSIPDVGDEGVMTVNLQVPNPVSLITQKLLALPHRKRDDERSKDLLYVVELLAAFADVGDELAQLARQDVLPALTRKETSSLARQRAGLVPESDLLLASAVQAGVVGRQEWSEPAALAGAIQAGLRPWFEGGAS